MVDEKVVGEKDFAEVLISDVTHKIMGRALDIMRTSEMSDRAFNQATRTMKDYVNELTEYCIKTLKERGYIKN